MDLTLACSFCGKPSTEVRKLVAGPGVYICDVCVDLAHKIVGEELENQSSSVRFPSWETLTDEEMLGHLSRSGSVSAQVEADLRAWVLELRRRGVTWTRIGQALGVTRQSAWERFSGEE